MDSDAPSAPATRPLGIATYLGIALVIAGVVLMFLTTQIGPTTPFSSLEPHRHRLIAAEFAVVAIVVIELVNQAIARHFHSRGAVQAGMSVRLVVRLAGYTIIAVAVLSILSTNPALAVGVGSVTGLVVGLAAQNVIGNALAGMLIAIARPFELGQEVTVSGITGRVVRVGSMHTVIDTGEREALVPNTMLLTQVVQRVRYKP